MIKFKNLLFLIFIFNDIHSFDSFESYSGLTITKQNNFKCTISGHETFLDVSISKNVKDEILIYFNGLSIPFYFYSDFNYPVNTKHKIDTYFYRYFEVVVQEKSINLNDVSKIKWRSKKFELSPGDTYFIRVNTINKRINKLNKTEIRAIIEKAITGDIESIKYLQEHPEIPLKQKNIELIPKLDFEQKRRKDY